MKHLNPKAKWLFFFRNIGPVSVLILPYSAFVLVVAYIAHGDPAAWDKLKVLILASLLLVILTILITYIWARLAYKYYRYEMTNDSFNKEYGVVSKKYVSIPYSRIQNVDIYRSLPMRMLGLAELRIHTAGAGLAFSSDGIVSGLLTHEAEQIRNVLMEKVGNRNQGL